MLIRAGYDIRFDTNVPAPMMAMLSVHPSRNKDLRSGHRILASPDVPIYDYLDAFGNVCTRVVVPTGGLTLSCDFTIEDDGAPDAYVPDAVQHAIEDLPDDILVYLLGSRYCETDRLSETAWSLFGHVPPGWARVQAIVDFTTTASNSATITPAPPRRRGTRTRSSRGSAATSRTWRSRCAGA